MVIPVDTGLLVLRGNNQLIRRKLKRLLELAVTKVRHKLYVHVEEREGFRELLPAIYLSAASLQSQIDLRVLIDRQNVFADRVFYDEVKDPDHPTFPMLAHADAEPDGTGIDIINKLPIGVNIHPGEKPYKHVIMGGTFDRLHNGHKVLLSEAILLAREQITCGVTDGDMIKKKTLWELIEPVDKRCKEVVNFVEDVSSNIKCLTVPIYDAFGPSIVGTDYQAIIVSEETLAGGKAVNAKRQEKGLNHLEIHVVHLLGSDELNDQMLKEKKISSSARRRQLLGTILREPTDNISPISPKHYVIGLTGGIASGKTHIAKYLKSQGCEVIDCDVLVHKLYSESEELRTILAKQFGDSIVTNGDIDRKALSDLVFNDKSKLIQLNAIVWPLAANRVKNIIKNSNKEIVIIDAALLLEAGWESFLHQVWTVFVPHEEAISRITARDKVTIEKARERLDNQLGNAERIARSNVVFCSLWDYSETERQVQNALEKTKAEYVPSYFS